MPVVHDAFSALADVHARGITHRALRCAASRSPPPTACGSATSTAPTCRRRRRSRPPRRRPSVRRVPRPRRDDGDVHRGRRPLQPGALPGPVAVRRRDRSSPTTTSRCRRAQQYPVVGQVLARCLSREPGEPFTAAAAAAATDPQPPRPPVVRDEVIEPGALLGGRYRLKRPLGEGAWAVTWLAYDENLDEHRTVKHMRPGRVTPEQVKAEYEHARSLRSFHCAQMHDRLAVTRTGRPRPGVRAGGDPARADVGTARARQGAGPADRGRRAARPRPTPTSGRSTTGTSARTTSSSATTATPY